LSQFQEGARKMLGGERDLQWGGGGGGKVSKFFEPYPDPKNQNRSLSNSKYKTLSFTRSESRSENSSLLFRSKFCT